MNSSRRGSDRARSGIESAPAGPAISQAEKFLGMAKKVLEMAEDLQARGFHAEAVEFALIANQYVQAAKALRALSLQ